MEPLILASRSPRRKEILEKFNIPYTAIPSPLKEEFNHDPPLEQVKRLSKEKVDALLKTSPSLSSRLILGADTAIVFDGSIMGKPVNAMHAEEMLRHFSGKTHQVITGLTLYNGETKNYLQETESASVSFAPLQEEEIQWYLSTKEWKGVAGGYRIQEKGALLIKSISGSYYTIMGLPIQLFYGMLKRQIPQFSLSDL